MADRNPFAVLPAPTWERKRTVPAVKAEATEYLTSIPLTTSWWAWAARGPDADGKPATPNQHGVGLGIAVNVNGIDAWREEIDRWYNWQESALMGTTYRRAEALGGDYQELYIFADCLIAIAAIEQGEPDVLKRAVMDLRRHAAINRLLRLPGVYPPRSYSFGCRTSIPDETTPQALACVLEGLPLEEWGEHGGQPLGRQLTRPGRLTGIHVLRIMLAGGLVELPMLATMDDTLREIEATGLRLPWPMRWRAWVSARSDKPKSYWAMFGGNFPDGGEKTGGVLGDVTAGGGVATHASTGQPPLVAPDWDLTIGPDGLTVHRRPGTAEPDPGDKPTPSRPPEPPDPEPADLLDEVRAWAMRPDVPKGMPNFRAAILERMAGIRGVAK